MNVLVTGASSGIGEAVARHFAKIGAQVVLVSEQEEALNRIVSSIREENGIAFALVADFSKRDQVSGLVAKAESQIGNLDVLVNNAGIGLGAKIIETKAEDLRLLFEVNFFALAELCQQALKVMTPRSSGRIINVSSAAGRFGSPGVSSYSATKGAVHAYTQSLRIEAAQNGIFVTEILPISVKTSFFDRAKGRRYQPSGVILTPEYVADQIVKCAHSKRPLAEILPYRPVRLAFVLETLLPSFMARYMIKKWEP